MHARFARYSPILTACMAIACSSATTAPRNPAPAGSAVPSVTNPVAGSRYPHTRGDVEFMSGMIPHHAQAVLIAGWAPSHGSSGAVQRLAERIVVAQRDEIALMRQWLGDRGEPVPPPDATHHRMVMGGVEHDMLMPGMLNPEELAQLDRARGVEFDRLFLTYMIRHHEGALVMVDQLFASPGAGQDDIVYKFVSDVWADQSTEIDFMQKMLADLSGHDRP